MAGDLNGGCLCGAVHYECTAEQQVVVHCHCDDCRKSSGTGHGTHVGVGGASFRLSGDVSLYDHPADSGNIVSRAFCPNCGSAIYSTNSGWEGMIFVRASSLDDPNAVKPQMSVYASRAADWDPVDPSLPSFPEMPPNPPQ